MPSISSENAVISNVMKISVVPSPVSAIMYYKARRRAVSGGPSLPNHTLNVYVICMRPLPLRDKS